MVVGYYFDGVTAQAHQVDVEFRAGVLNVRGQTVDREAPYSTLTVSESLGKTSRSIYFSDGARLDLPDVAELDQITPKDAFYWSDLLERRWSVVLAALGLVVFLSWAAITFGIPAAAKGVASVMPPSVDEAIGDEGLALMDRLFFSASELDESRKRELTDYFEAVTSYAQDDHDFRLEFRTGGAIGPNAFALPSGIIVITDEMVEFAEREEEIIGVLAHEVGHVVHRHSMRLLLQSSTTALLIATMTGDLTSLSSLAASIPTVLVQTSYSREFEREADIYAFDYLDYIDVSPDHLTNLLIRLEDEFGGSDGGATNYLSTHPVATERRANNER